MSIVKTSFEVELETVNEPAVEQSIIQVSTGPRQLYKEIVGFDFEKLKTNNTNKPYKAREIDFDSGSIDGQKNDTLTLVFKPEIVYRLDRMLVTDSWTPPGSGTGMTSMTINGRLNRPFNNGMSLSMNMNPSPLGSGIRYDTCQPGSSIEFEIKFLQTCTFMMALFGRGVL